MKVAVSKVKPSPDNAAGRSNMDDAMKELIGTIKAVGMVEPIIVFSVNQHFEIIEGERRLFAAKKAGLKEVDVVVREDVDRDQARLMRLASLTNEDWEYEEFAEKIWNELDAREISQSELAVLIGLKQPRVHGAVNFHAAKLGDAVVVIDGKIRADATSAIWSALKNIEIIGADNIKGTLMQVVAAKVSEEWKPEAGVKTRNFALKLCKRIKKATTIVEIGDEKFNFELEAILETPFDTKNFNDVVAALAEAKRDMAESKHKADEENERAVKGYLDVLGPYLEGLAKIIRAVDKFSPEGADQVIAKQEKVIEREQELIAKLKPIAAKLEDYRD